MSQPAKGAQIPPASTLTWCSRIPLPGTRPAPASTPSTVVTATLLPAEYPFVYATDAPVGATTSRKNERVVSSVLPARSVTRTVTGVGAAVFVGSKSWTLDAYGATVATLPGPVKPVRLIVGNSTDATPEPASAAAAWIVKSPSAIGL